MSKQPPIDGDPNMKAPPPPGSYSVFRVELRGKPEFYVKGRIWVDVRDKMRKNYRELLEDVILVEDKYEKYVRFPYLDEII
jgi:hypothetical protein